MQSIDSLPKFLIDVSSDISAAGGQAYLVGGWVRDALLGVDSKDYDVEVYGLDEDQLLQILSQYGKASSVGKSFGVYIIKVGKIHYDFSFPRTETKVGEGHRGFEVHPDPTLNFTEASSRRDFTINAMGFNLKTLEITDPQGGQEDLKQGILRHVGPAFGEDPLRVLRAIQFIARFDLSIPPETIAICREQDLSELSTERFEEEFKKLLLKGHKISRGLSVIRDMGLLRFFPEMDSLLPPENHVGERLDLAHFMLTCFNEEREQLIFMYTLLTISLNDKTFDSFMARFTNDVKLLKGISERRKAWDIYKQWLNFNKDELQQGYSIGLPPGVIRRISLACPILEFIHLRALIEEPVSDLKASTDVHAKLENNQLSRVSDADFLSVHSFEMSQVLFDSARQWGCLRQEPEAWYQGRDLIEMGFSPGPLFGEALKECFELQLDEFFENKEKAAEWLRLKLS